MIGKLTGRLDYKALDHIVIDVAGVGYVVYCSDRVMAALPALGAPISLYTDLLVREDLLQLFGFSTLLEKEWHRLLMSVQGVGAKASLAVLGTLGAEGVGRAVALGDVNAVKAAKGIGPKTAQRIVIELKDKAPKVMAMGATLSAGLGEVPAAASAQDASAAVIEPVPTPQRDPSAQADALSALLNLGYGHSDAAAAVAQVAGEEPEADVKGLIRGALRLLGPKE